MAARSTAAPGPAVALVLQGGGALGAYHIGAYQALAEHELLPDWVAGISIGALNAAVIAGNPPQERVERLAALWETISWPGLTPPPLRAFPALDATTGYAEALLFGQPHFFTPRLLNPWLRPPAPPQEVSFYDLTPLSDTLRRFTDLALVNRGVVRLSLGATNVETGNLVFFDSQRQTIGVEHVLASCSLPPGFAATVVEGVPYWDGACVANTPLDAVTGEADRGHRVVFLVDLWSAAGPPPETMNAVLWRARSIEYASRTALHVDAVAATANLRHALRQLQAIDPAHAAVPDSAALAAQRLDIVHIVYRPDASIIANSDADFSRGGIAERRAAGYRDMQAALAAAPWLRQPKPAHVAALVHRVERGAVVTQPVLGAQPGDQRPAQARTSR